MVRFLMSAVAAAVLALPAVADDKASDKMSPLEFTLKDIKGQPVELSKYKGKVVLFVNVASKCGLTPQYKGLEALYGKYKDQGLVVIGVPANEFGEQEPGTDEEIEKFCSAKYNVTFPMMGKIVVKGKGIDPLYAHLTAVDTKPAGKGAVSWNFEKFLVGKDGKVAARFAPKTAPDSDEFVAAIETALKAK